MVKMENYSPDAYRELSMKLDELHMSYVGMEDNEEKLLYRTKLEECIAEFLSVAHHRDKFIFREVEDTLYRSAAFKKDFSAYKAATSWNSIQIYASNLTNQPWRKEYRQIKTYCGFYKHQIEANLTGVEAVFGAMGYKNMGNGIMELDFPFCPDRVFTVSRDCLVAYVECQILKYIWEQLSPILSSISWLDVLEYRIQCQGSPDECIRNIKYKYNAKTFLQSARSVPQQVEMYDNRHQQRSVSPANLMMANPYSALPNYHHVPSISLPSGPCCVPHSNGYPTSYTTYGYGTCPSAIPLFNGYYANGLPVVPMVPAVPTAQLIELESHRNGYDIVDQGVASSAKPRRSRVESNAIVVSEQSGAQENGPSQSNDKPESQEDWSYVYKDLENKGYSKDLGERGDILTELTVGDTQRKHPKELKKGKATNLDDALLLNLSLAERPLKMTEALEHMEKKSLEKNTQHRERKYSQGSSYENVVNKESSKETKPVARVTQTLPFSAKAKSKDGAEAETSQAKRHQNGSTAKWECKACTYLNALKSDICEICCKSRDVEKEEPMEVGGPECSQCTLVNRREAKICKACGNDLKNSPTYI